MELNKIMKDALKEQKGDSYFSDLRHPLNPRVGEKRKYPTADKKLARFWRVARNPLRKNVELTAIQKLKAY